MQAVIAVCFSAKADPRSLKPEGEPSNFRLHHQNRSSNPHYKIISTIAIARIKV